MKRLVGLFLMAGAVSVPTSAVAQTAGEQFLPVGSMAPDLQWTGSTRHGVLREAVRLSDLRGNTVVLAYFFRARSVG